VNAASTVKGVEGPLKLSEVSNSTELLVWLTPLGVFEEPLVIEKVLSVLSESEQPLPFAEMTTEFTVAGVDGQGL
jgi:hypothetical protein